MNPLLEEINAHYLTVYSNKYDEILGKHGDKESERFAQKYAIRKTALTFFKKYPAVDKREIWNMVYSTHVSRKCGVEITHEVIEQVKSADQSWKKSSGHAFEEMVKELCNDSLGDIDIKILLQKDVSLLIKRGEVKNEDRDIEWIKNQIKLDTFDLFAVDKEGYIFGCIQAKTSIRDRVTRDREPSMIAMGRFLWSAVFVLDGDFLKLPKFKSMVNGETNAYDKNGWHALYAFSIPKGVAGDRIYQLDIDMRPFVTHVRKALKDWRERRQWLDSKWISEK